MDLPIPGIDEESILGHVMVAPNPRGRPLGEQGEGPEARGRSPALIEQAIERGVTHIDRIGRDLNHFGLERPTIELAKVEIPTPGCGREGVEIRASLAGKQSAVRHPTIRFGVLSGKLPPRNNPIVAKQ